MVAVDWRPTVDSYLGRVTKARILAAVAEVKGSAQAQMIDHLKKPEMASEAETQRADSGWVPEPMWTPTVDEASGTLMDNAIIPSEDQETPSENPDRSDVAKTAAEDGERAIDPDAADGDDDPEPKDALQAAA